jgi:hypothetical protein
MRPSAAKAGHPLEAFTYGLKPVPFRMSGGLVQRGRLMGCAPSFSAHVRSGEHGAPVQVTRLAVVQKITPPNPPSINGYLCDALH